MLEQKNLISHYIKTANARLEREKAAAEAKPTSEAKAIRKELKQEEKDEKVRVGADHVEKMASAIEYIVDNFDDLLPKGPLARAIDKVANNVGEGAGAVPVSKAGKPHADYAKKDKMAVTEDPSEIVTSTGRQGEIANNADKKPGGGLLKTEPFVNKPTVKHAALRAMWEKLAGEDVLKANVPRGSGNAGVVRRMDATESAGTPPGHDQSGFGNENERHIMTVDSARSFTKRDAKKEYIKRELGRVFEETNPEKDTALDRAWTRGRDTAKLASPENVKKMEKLIKKEQEEEKTEEEVSPGIHDKLKKIAQMASLGCKCGDSGSCKFCTSKTAMASKIAHFLKRAGAPGMDPAVPATQPAAGGKDPSLGAQTAPLPTQAPPDCQCGGQGMCPPCKKAQLAAIMAQAGGKIPGAGGGQPPMPAGMPSNQDMAPQGV